MIYIHCKYCLFSHQGEYTEEVISISMGTSNKHFATNKSRPRACPPAKTKRTNQFDVLLRAFSFQFRPTYRNQTKISVHRLFYAQFYDSRLPVIKRPRPTRAYLKTPFIIYHALDACFVSVFMRAFWFAQQSRHAINSRASRFPLD